MKDWEKFMLESNRIEGEDRLNPGDENAFFCAISLIDNLNDILGLHELLGEYLKQPWVGAWRKCNVQVGGYLAPGPLQVPALMEVYIQKFPDMDSYDAHNEFEKIHPFQDLNGRAGRLIWLSKAIDEGYDFGIPFLQKYYYQTLARSNSASIIQCLKILEHYEH